MEHNTSIKAAKAVLLAATLLGATAANANTYYLENNNLSQPGDLASVMLVDNGSNVDITVTAIAPNLQVAGLGFNLAGNPASISCTGLPANYSCNTGTFQYDGGGNFTDQADPPDFSTGNRYSSFSFTLLGYNEANFQTNTPEGNLFATHVYLDIIDPSTGNPLTGYAFGGSQVPQEVPVPAAVWLFGSGLFGMVAVARRKKASMVS